VDQAGGEMIIGLTGKNGSGKGEVAKFLKERGFEYHSLSDVVREEVQNLGKPVTRGNLIQAGNDLRKKFGPQVLAERIIERLRIDKHYVVDSIRHPSEAAALRTKNGFVLINVMASPEIRFERLKSRARENDPKTLKDFNKLEAKEGKSRTASDQQLDETLKLADYLIENTGSLKELYDKVIQVVNEIAQKKKRPGWDEYFLEIAKVVALRSNCIKRKVAAVIVKDKRIISTGYNGTPRGVKNCNEGGCPRCNQLTTSGTKLDECLCSHGEENAITQAAYHGVCIKDATIYTTYSPCLLCTKLIINSGIREVVFNQDYPLAETAMGLLREAGVKVRKIKLD
jgi:dCMP deaminase